MIEIRSALNIFAAHWNSSLEEEMYKDESAGASNGGISEGSEFSDLSTRRCHAFVAMLALEADVTRIHFTSLQKDGYMARL